MTRFLTTTIFDKLLAELGIPHGQFIFEASKFELSPRAWLEERLRAMGWVKKSEIEAPPECGRECCR